MRRDRLAREAEEERLAPAATRRRIARRAASRGAGRVSHRLRARPRSDPPLQGVPAAEAQDPGLHQPGRRPLHHPPVAHAAGHADLARARRRAEPQRIAGRSDRARPRRGALAVRPHRRGGASPYFPGDGWHHAAQSVRIFEMLENLNLTWEVRDGIRAHSWKISRRRHARGDDRPLRRSDRVPHPRRARRAARRRARAATISRPRALERFGPPGREWIEEMITAVIDESLRHGRGADGSADPRGDDRAARRSCSSASTCHRRSASTPTPAVALIRRLVDHHLDHPDELPTIPRHRCRPDHPGGRLRRGHDRPLRGAGQREAVRLAFVTAIHSRGLVFSQD